MDGQHMSQKVFANFIGLSEGSLSGLFSGRTRPTLNIVELIKEKIPAISTDWLMFGKGRMYEDETAGNEQQNTAVEESSLNFATSTPSPIGDLFEAASRPAVRQEVVKEPQKEVKFIDKPQRKITEIKVFYDDQTFESFVPKK